MAVASCDITEAPASQRGRGGVLNMDAGIADKVRPGDVVWAGCSH